MKHRRQAMFLIGLAIIAIITVSQVTINKAIAGVSGTAVQPSESSTQRIISPNKQQSVNLEGSTNPTGPNAGRIITGLVSLYTFEEGPNSTYVYDVSNSGNPLDLIIANGSSTAWIPGGGLAINGSSLIVSAGPADKVIQAAKLSNEITVEAWIVPANTTQNGPARIVSLSGGATTRNFTLAQGLWGNQPSALYDARLRSNGGVTDDNGQPSLSSASGSAQVKLQQVVLTFKNGIRTLYIDGSQVESDSIGGSLGNWDGSFPLFLANESDGARPWLGEMYLVAIYDQALTAPDVLQNFNTGLPGAVPPTPTNTPIPVVTNTSTPTPEPNCPINPNNILANPSFENNMAYWAFYINNGAGQFLTVSNAYHCNTAAELDIETAGSYMQLHQNNFTLKANTQYRLSFAGYSNTGHDLRVYLQQKSIPQNNFGIKNQTFDLTTAWNEFSYDFTTTGFSGTISDTRLRFWLVGNAADGDIYWLDNIQIEEILPGVPTSTPVPATDIPTNTPTSTPSSGSSCAPNLANVLANPSFEEGNGIWTFHTDGSGSFDISSPAAHCDNAARLTFNTVGKNMQLYQTGFPLKANTPYRLSFSAFSNSGQDLKVYLQKHTPSYTSFGVNNQTFNLTNSWQNFTHEFTTSGFNGTSSDTRLRFWFVGNATDGDIYWIDNVVLEEIGSGSQPTATATPNSVPTAIPTATPVGAPTMTPTPTSGGGGGKNELLVFDWNKVVTENEKGFPYNQPPIANGDWTTPVNFAQGTLYYRVEIFSQPTAQNMRLQFCFWQAKNGNNFTLETCGHQESVLGSPGIVAEWSDAIENMWKKDGNPIEWDRARYRNGVAIKNSSGKPVSNYNGWNWNGENPKKWYPLDMRFTVVVVANGASFSGWQNYIK